MSLRKVKDGYLIIVMFVAILLATMGGWLGWLVAIVLLSGAMPAWNIVIQLAGDQGASEALSIVKQHLRRRNL